ncbi:hypothetical protein OAG76_01750 [Rubripirellula sp.]|nr:hypothetical protein [Rubripirellula sp.]MDB4634107.1 hypothetical protein [Rubripirellula sp.]
MNPTVISHQQHIVKVISAILQLDRATVIAFANRGNPFDKLLRSHAEFDAVGGGLYMSPGTENRKRLERQLASYKFSVKAYAAAMATGKSQYGEHRVPLSIIRKRLLACDGSEASVAKVMEASEVVIITKEEADCLDKELGLKTSLPANGIDRLDFAGINIASETQENTL